MMDNPNRKVVETRENRENLTERVEELEKDVDELKTSIKRLLIDIRETMNKVENPFEGLQGLADLHEQANQQSDQQSIRSSGSHKESGQRKRVLEEEVSQEPQDVGSELSEAIESARSLGNKKGQSDPAKKDEDNIKDILGSRSFLEKFDVVTLYNLMEWISGMLTKYDSNSIKNMLEVFEYAGYIDQGSRDFIVSLVELLDVNKEFEDILVELYRLHKTLYSEDEVMDSKMLDLLLKRKVEFGDT